MAADQWEYRFVEMTQGNLIENLQRLNDAGAEGWELVKLGNSAVMKRPVVPVCPTCEGDGWIIEPDHACGGDERVCAEACPAPFQRRCPDCDTEDNQPVTDGEEPF